MLFLCYNRFILYFKEGEPYDYSSPAPRGSRSNEKAAPLRRQDLSHCARWQRGPRDMRDLRKRHDLDRVKLEKAIKQILTTDNDFPDKGV